MKRLITICLAGFLVFFGSCGKQEPQKEQKEVEVEKEAVEEVAVVNEPNMPAEIAEPNELIPRRERGFRRRAGGRAGEEGEPFRPRRRAEEADVNEVVEPNEQEFINLKDVPMKDIIEKLADWTGKVIIPADEAMKERITIYFSGRLSRKEALANVYGALRMKGYIAEHTDDTIYIKPVQKAKIGFVPTIEPNQPLAMIENREQVVQKFFRLENYSVTRMSEILQPLISEYGYISADESSGNLLVIETVANLMRLESIIKQFDVPGAEQTKIKIFENIADPSEMVQILNIALGAQMTSAQRSRIEQLRRAGRPGGFDGMPSFSPRSSDSRSSGRSSNPGNPSSSNPGNPGNPESSSSTSSSSNPKSSSLESSNPESLESSRSAGAGARANARTERAKAEKKVSGVAATSVTVGGEVSTPPILIPDPKRGLIIARASQADIEKIAYLIDELTKLDMEAVKEAQYDVITIEHVDVDEVANTVNKDLQASPTEITANVAVTALSRTKQLLVSGSEESRKRVKEIVKTLDVPSALLLETRTFSLKHISCEKLKELIDELYGAGAVGIAISRVAPSRRVSAMDEVRTVAYSALNQLTVIASPSNLEMIAQMIEGWDVPLDIEAVKPLIIELRNLDPIKMTELLTKIFSGETTGVRDIQQFLRGTGTALETKKEIVGPLYGQFTVEAVEGTKKIIVISKVPEAYKVIEVIVRDLDRKEPAELPRLVILKYADPEDLAERLNAMFNLPGTNARTQRTEKGLTYTITTTTEEQQATTEQQAGQQATTTTEYTPWWSGSGARVGVGEEMPISNVIGMIRIIPYPRTKAILVLAHPEYLDEIEKLIAGMDKPGKQVMIKAMLVEVNRSKLGSAGVQLASDPTAFGALGENAITVLNNLTQQEKHGAMIFGADKKQGSTFALGITADITVLLDFLVKYTDAKILYQPTLWTKDNADAWLFKGAEVPFQTTMSLSETGGRATSSYEYKKIGITLQVKPNITPENNVDMLINLALSQFSKTDLFNSQPVTPMTETKNSMIVKDGGTILLGGVLTQEDTNIKRKLPLLGDAPLVGGLFRHNIVTKSNSELLVFITPHVVEEESRPEDIADVKNALEKKESVEQHLDEMVSEWLEEK